MGHGGVWHGHCRLAPMLNEGQRVDTNTSKHRMVSLQPALTSLLDSLPPHPIDHQQLDGLVRKTLDGAKSKLSPDIRKSQWEYLLRDDIFKLAVMLTSVVARAPPHHIP